MKKLEKSFLYYFEWTVFDIWQKKKKKKKGIFLLYCGLDIHAFWDLTFTNYLNKKTNKQKNSNPQTPNSGICSFHSSITWWVRWQFYAVYTKSKDIWKASLLASSEISQEVRSTLVTLDGTLNVMVLRNTYGPMYYLSKEVTLKPHHVQKWEHFISWQVP